MGAFQGNNQPTYIMPLTADDSLNAPPYLLTEAELSWPHLLLFLPALFAPSLLLKPVLYHLLHFRRSSMKNSGICLAKSSS